MATPSNADEACAINIGNIDCNAVSEDDIVDWLKLLGEVKSISRRYNPTTNETGYRLVFRHAATANLAVQFVDGVVFRDKERPLSITSSVFTKSAKIGSSGISGEAMEDSGGASAPPAGVDNAADQRVAQGRTILPSNQQMPDDLQMDFQLVCTIPQLLEAERIASGADDVSTDDSLFALGPELLHGSQEAFKTLQELQLKYICVRREAEELDTKLEAKRAHVNELLLGGHNRRQSDGTRSPPPGAVGGWGSQAAAESVELATSLIPLRITTTATPLTTPSAPSLVSSARRLRMGPRCPSLSSLLGVSRRKSRFAFSKRAPQVRNWAKSGSAMRMINPARTRASTSTCCGALEHGLKELCDCRHETHHQGRPFGRWIRHRSAKRKSWSTRGASARHFVVSMPYRTKL